MGDETPRLADKEKMPYMEAVSSLVFRSKWVSPMNFQRVKTSDETTFEPSYLMFQTMYELLRYISHVPTLLPHAAMEDTTLGGYTIPKDTQVMKFIVAYA